jgi:hypothetical protein
MSLLILVVDDEPDVEVLFRQRFRRDPVQTGSRWSLRNLVPPQFSASVMRQAYHSS